MTIEKRKIPEEPIILLPEHEEDEEDLSWMIQDKKIVNKYQSKFKKNIKTKKKFKNGKKTYNFSRKNI